MSEGRYIFDNAWQEDLRRLRALEAGWDATSIEGLEAVGVTNGWRCREVGAGGGSMAAWLCTRVGETGRVVATDLDTRFVDLLELDNLEVRRHDIVQDELERETYDLVHTRLLLEHLPGQDAALDRMIAALRPGGWLVAEEFDHVTMQPSPDSAPQAIAVWSSFRRAFESLAAQRGLDLSYGAGLASMLERRGLNEVQATGRTFSQTGGAHLSTALRMSIEHLTPALVATECATNDELRLLVELLANPGFRWTTQLMVSARGQKPFG